MNNLVVMLRNWEPMTHSGSYSTSMSTGVGGTEFQMLLQSRALTEMGYKVVVIGATVESIEENGVTFYGTKSMEDTYNWLRSNGDEIQAIFVNSREWVEKIKQAAPNVMLVQVCQNGPFFEFESYIDIYGMASPGQMALYSVNEPKFRNKYMMLPNATAWESIFEKLKETPKKNQIIWVGAYEKQGLRRWGKAMCQVLQENKQLCWKLLAPSYSRVGKSGRPEALAGLSLPWDRIETGNLPMDMLSAEMASSKMLLASLGGEDGGITYLDGHAAGIPVLSGDDIMAKYWNPEGTGLRCTTWRECLTAIRYLLENEDIAAKMGTNGRTWVTESFSEENQRRCLRNIMDYIEIQKQKPIPVKASLQSDKKFSLKYRVERLEIKVANSRTR